MSLEILSTNLPSVLLGGVLCIIISFMSYVIYAFSIKEKSFEEVIEEQRKQSQLEELKHKNEKAKKEKEKKHKKWGPKKSKEKQEPSPPASEIQVPSNAAPEQVEEIEIIEPKEIVTSKKKSKAPTQKPNTPPLNAKTTNGISSAEKVVIVQSPLEAEKKGKVDTKEKENAKSSELKKSPVNEVEITVSNDPAPVQPVPLVSSATVSKKKKKVEQSDKTANGGPVNATKLITLIKETALDDHENQMLIDMLLNKQKEASGWKKVDHHVIVKKQVPEKESSLEHDLRVNKEAIAALKQELSQEKVKAATLKKTSEEEIARQNLEINSLNMRLKKNQEQLNVEKTISQEKIKQTMEKSAEEKLDGAVRKVTEEKDKLSKSLKKLETETRSAQSNEFDTLKKTHGELQKVHKLLVEQHTLLIGSHKREILSLNIQLSDAKKSAQESVDKNLALSKEVDALKKSCEDLKSSRSQLELEVKDIGVTNKTEIKNLEVLLDASKGLCGELECQAKKLSERVTELSKQNSSLSSEVQKLQAENEKLSAELAESQERVAGDGQEMLQQNGEISRKEKESEKEIIEKQEKILKEKENVLTQLYDDLNASKTKVVSLNNELELQKQKNNELREKNWKAVEALGVAEKTAAEKVKQMEKEFNDKLKHTSDLSESQTEKSLQETKDELNKQVQEYNVQLRNNSQLSSEIKQLRELHITVENQLADTLKAKEELKSQLTDSVVSSKSSLQRLFPTININNALPHTEWLSQFTDEAAHVLQSSAEPQNEELLARLTSEHKEMQETLHHYKAVLADTEATLNRLQESAKDQESMWTKKLQCKQQEVEELNEKLKSLQSTIDESGNLSSSLETKLEEVNNNCINLKHQIESKDKAIEDLQKEVASFANVKKDLEKMESDLEKEKKINKDFSFQMTRLSSLVKIGQDALSEEQERVKNLQTELQAAKVATTANGTSSPTIAENNELSVKAEKVKKSKNSDASKK